MTGSNTANWGASIPATIQSPRSRSAGLTRPGSYFSARRSHVVLRLSHGRSRVTVSSLPGRRPQRLPDLDGSLHATYRSTSGPVDHCPDRRFRSTVSVPHSPGRCITCRERDGTTAQDHDRRARVTAARWRSAAATGNLRAADLTTVHGRGSCSTTPMKMAPSGSSPVASRPVRMPINASAEWRAHGSRSSTVMIRRWTEGCASDVVRSAASAPMASSGRADGHALFA